MTHKLKITPEYFDPVFMIAETTKEFVISNQHMSDALNDENLFKSDEQK